MSLRPDRKNIKQEWIERVISSPEKRRIQADQRIRLWGKVPEMNNRYLRVIVLKDGETVHNAFLSSEKLTLLKVETWMRIRSLTLMQKEKFVQ